MSEDKAELNQSDTEIESADNAEIELQAEEQVSQDKASVDGDANVNVQALQEQLAEAKEQVLRVQAESQNIRRRSQIDVEKAHKFGVEKLVRELLPVVDGLENAINNFDGSEAAIVTMKEGVEMTLSMLLKGLEKHSVEQVDPHGEPFDPAHHEAMTMIDAPGTEPNSVINVVQKGYKLNGRLVRPAMVVVSKSSPKIDENA